MVVDGVTSSSEGPGTTVSGAPLSLGSGGLMVGSDTVRLPTANGSTLSPIPPIKCRNLLGKQAQIADLLDELTESTIALFGNDHAWVKYLLDPRNLSREPDEDTASPIESVNTALGSIDVTENLVPVARIAKYGYI